MLCVNVHLAAACKHSRVTADLETHTPSPCAEHMWDAAEFYLAASLSSHNHPHTRTLLVISVASCVVGWCGL